MPLLDARTVLLTLAALRLVALGTVSASNMAPDRAMLERQAFLQLTGAGDEELCGFADSAHDHRCPLCHGLPSPPRLAAPEGAATVARAEPAVRDAHLVAGPVDIRSPASPRGPPLTV